MYHERGGVFLSSFEAERERILSGRDESSTEVEYAMSKPRDNPFPRISLYFNYIISPTDVSIFHRFIFSGMIWRIRTLHMHSENLYTQPCTLFQIRLFWTFCLSCYISTLSSIHLTDSQPLNLTKTSLAFRVSTRLRKTCPWMVSPAK